MATIKYETTDIMPMVLIVLNYISCDLTSTVFKLALDNQLADLKGRVDPEVMDQAMHDITEELDDPLSVLLLDFSLALIAVYGNLAVAQNYKLELLFADERLTDMASDVYVSRSLYTAGMTDSNMLDLDIYLYSLPVVIDELINLMITEQFDDEELKLWSSLDVHYFDQFQEAKQAGIKELAELAQRTYDYHRQVKNFIH